MPAIDKVVRSILSDRDAIRRVSKARSQLVLSSQPFYGCLLLSLELVVSKRAGGYGTMAVTNKHLLFNPAFVSVLTDAQLRGLLVHEVSHLAYRHHVRRGSRRMKEWQHACDYAVNRDVIEQGYELPPNGLMSDEYPNMGAEQIYAVILKAQEEEAKKAQEEQDKSDDGSDDKSDDEGEGQPSGSSASKDENSEDEKKGDQQDKSEPSGDKAEPGEPNKGEKQEPASDDGKGKEEPSEDDDPEGNGQSEPEQDEGATGKEPEESESGEEDKPSEGWSEGDKENDDESDDEGDDGEAEGDQSEEFDPDHMEDFDPGMWGIVLDSEDPEAGTEWAAKVLSAAAIAAQCGNLPAAIKRMVETITGSARQNWRDVLREFVDQSVSKDRSWNRPDRRHVGSGLYLPGNTSDATNLVLVAIDTSGSISQPVLDAFLKEMQDILDSGAADKIIAVCCDAVLYEEQEFEQGDDIKAGLILTGGGGTNFAPVMKWAGEHHESPSCLIYFTDMVCSSFGNDPFLPVLWIRDGAYANNPPFGQLVELDAYDNEG